MFFFLKEKEPKRTLSGEHKNKSEVMKTMASDLFFNEDTYLRFAF